MYMYLKNSPSNIRKVFPKTALYALTPMDQTGKGEFVQRAHLFKNPYNAPDEVGQKAAKVLSNNSLSSKGKFALEQMSEHKIPLLILRDMPIAYDYSKWPVKPKDQNEKDPKKDHVSEALILGLGNILGGQVQTSDGKSPIKQNFGQVAKSKNFTEDIHTKYAQLPFQPDFYVLSALRGDQKSRTQFIDINKIIETLDKDVVQSLREKNFQFNHKDGTKGYVGSILRRNMDGTYQVRLNLAADRIIPRNKDAKNALASLRQALEGFDGLESVNLEAGDVAVADNRKVLHVQHPYQSTSVGDKERWYQQGYFKSQHDFFDVDSYAFKDKKGRNCHELLPRQRQYENIKDFAANASKKEKIQLLDKVMEITAGSRGFRFVIDQDPKTKKMRIYAACTKDPKYKDNRWERKGDLYDGYPVSMTNNPLYEKSKAGLDSTKYASKHFVVFPTPKPNHSLITPRQELKYRDLIEFIGGASDAEKVELFDVLAKKAEPDNKIYINVGVCRHIPWFHIHMLYGDFHKNKRF